MIGLAGQSAAVEEMMTGRENLVMVARLYGQGRNEAVASAKRILEQMDLVDAADRRVKTYSGGMRRRLDLGASLVGSPRLLLLDEPTTGLDPGSRNEVWDAIQEMSAGGTDIVLTTQYLDEADHLAATSSSSTTAGSSPQGTPDELKSRVGADMVELHTVDVADHAAGGRGARRRSGVAEPSTDPATRRCSHRRAGRFQVAARRRAGARRRGGAGGGHRAAPAHPRRGVPGPDRATTTSTDHIPTSPKEDAAVTMDITLEPAAPGGPADDGRRRRTRGRRISSPRARWRPGPSRSSSARRR